MARATPLACQIGLGIGEIISRTSGLLDLGRRARPSAGCLLLLLTTTSHSRQLKTIKTAEVFTVLNRGFICFDKNL